MNDDDQRLLFQKFAGALATYDEPTLREVCTDDVVWTIAGNSEISGNHLGVTDLVATQRRLQSYQIDVQLKEILFGRESFVVILHDTGDRDGKQLDVRVALLVSLRDGKISALTGHVIDTQMFSDYLS